MVTMFDYSAGRIAPAALTAAGCQAVFRYVSTPGNPKNITKSELAELLAAGIGVGLVYETTANWMLGDYNAGLTAARSARQQATAAGYDPAATIWYAADFDATPAQVTTVLDTLHGCADAEGSASRVAVYGGYAVCEAAAAAGFAYPWQTVAWSNGVWCATAMARQTGQSLKVGDVQVDINQIMSTGPWQQPQPKEIDMILHTITGSPQVWALSGGLYWHVNDTASQASYKAAGVPTATITAPEHAAILAAVAAQTAGGASAAAVASAVLAAQGAADTAAAKG